jgi:hypothetical protein
MYSISCCAITFSPLNSLEHVSKTGGHHVLPRDLESYLHKSEEHASTRKLYMNVLMTSRLALDMKDFI